jgi:predicted transcriptional regulator
LPEDDEMTPAERSELLASIEQGLAEAERGELIPADEVLRRLRET